MENSMIKLTIAGDILLGEEWNINASKLDIDILQPLENVKDNYEKNAVIDHL
jgi:hypothetical protein